MSPQRGVKMKVIINFAMSKDPPFGLVKFSTMFIMKCDMLRSLGTRAIVCKRKRGRELLDKVPGIMGQLTLNDVELTGCFQERMSAVTNNKL